MENPIKKLILWINENSGICAITALTACIPGSIIFAFFGLKIWALVFGFFAIFGALFWFTVGVSSIISVFEILWKKLVAWAQK